MITKSRVEAFTKEFLITMEELGRKHGLGIKLGKITLDSDNFRAKVTAVEIAEGLSIEQAEFNKDCVKYGLKPSDYRRTVFYKGTYLQLLGFKPRKNKYPILVYNLDLNKRMFITKDVVISFYV